MTENPDTFGDIFENNNHFTETQNREFAAVLESVLESASAVFPGPEELEIVFTLALVGKMERHECTSLVEELPVVATIALRQQIGEKAAILTDIPTASTLAGLISSGESAVKETLSGDDLVSLFSALNPIIYALTRVCEESLGSPLGTIENVEIADADNRQSLIGELSESLCRATVSVKAGAEKGGQIVLLLPLELMESLAASGMALPGGEPDGGFEENEFPVQNYADEHLSYDETEHLSMTANVPPSPGEPTAQNIDLILDIQLKLAARLGQVEMPVGEILKLAPGSVIDIDRLVDEPIELLVNDRLIARGEIVVVQENFGIRITEIVSQKDRIRSLR
jgi:flagellar motor switch protein FliN/FliY